MFKHKHKKEADIEVPGFNSYFYIIDSISIFSLYGDSRFSGSIDKRRECIQERAWKIQDADHHVNSGKIGRHNG